MKKTSSTAKEEEDKQQRQNAVYDEEIMTPVRSPTKIAKNILAEEKKARMLTLKKMDNTIFEGINEKAGYGLQNFTSQNQLYKANSDNDYLSLEKNFSYGFLQSLQNIGMHYEHRRRLRAQHKPLRTGRFLSLLAEHQYGWHTHVLTFARYTKKQIAIVMINFNDGPVDGFITANRLKHLFPNFAESDIVVEVENWMQPQSNSSVIKLFLFIFY